MCSFSPCIEQVQRSCSAMADHGFIDITTLECLQRALDVRSISVPVANLGDGAANSYCDIGTKPAEFQHTLVAGRIETVAPKTWCHQKPKKAKHVTDTSENDGDSENDVRCVDDSGNVQPADEANNKNIQTHSKAESSNSHQLQCTKASYVFKSAQPVSQMTGHTGYLTFATLYPN